MFIKVILYIWSKVFYRNIWDLKQYLCQHEEKPSFLNKYFIAVYDKRHSENGSYIGYKADFREIPIFPHGIIGIFVSGGSKVGGNCVIYQQVTIGSNTLIDSPRFGSPSIGNNVLIGAGAKIIGKVTVGDNVRIGANAVVVRDVPANCTVVGDGRIIHKDGILDNRFFAFSQTQGKWGYFKNGKFVIDENINLKV